MAELLFLVSRIDYFFFSSFVVPKERKKKEYYCSIKFMIFLIGESNSCVDHWLVSLSLQCSNALAST
jgi:hypothetical protein